MKRFWKKYHKWVGLFFTFFILMFCFSGIVMNHRQLFSSCEVSRTWMPESYQYKNWNNGIVKGTLKLPDGKVLAYGNTGVWQTDSCFSAFISLNDGLKKGVDNRKISNVVMLSDGSIWCAGLYDIYQLSDGKWKICMLEGNNERISDITARQDTLIVLSRSYVYQSLAPYQQFTRYELKAPEGYSSEVSLFRTIWLLHSGELFGLPGKLVVDLLGVVLIILCLTGVIYTVLPFVMRRRNRKRLPVKGCTHALKVSAQWHNRLGAWLIVLTVLLAVTGMCLRPPLMIPFAMSKSKPIPGSVLDSDNAWHDKLRCIRWDDSLGVWLVSTSAGFYAMGDFESIPVKVPSAPAVSPMGINVFTKHPSGEWLVGSFSGMFRWHPVQELVLDYFTNAPVKRTFGRPVGGVVVSGYSSDLAIGKEVIFEYGKGATAKDGSCMLPAMPGVLLKQPISLWNFCLELHVGRCYSPFLGPFSELFVFLAGLLLTLILISGYIVYKKKRCFK